MKRIVTGSVAALFLSAALAAQSATPPPPPPPQQTPPTQQATPPQPPAAKTQDLTLVGCITQGTSASVFLFENAIDPSKKDEKPRAFRIVSSGEEMDFTPHLNHKMQLIGTLDPKSPTPVAPPAGGKIAEKDLPVFTVKAVSMVATTCSTPGQ